MLSSYLMATFYLMGSPYGFPLWGGGRAAVLCAAGLRTNLTAADLRASLIVYRAVGGAAGGPVAFLWVVANNPLAKAERRVRKY